ncbi:MAG: glycosyltransferase family 2 protein [Candidatus Omnitrophica bacterium]|nr:glycosyltransferase family 2 protein [Candidatus Omnitrophota bacterium]
MSQPLVSVIVLNWNGKDVIFECLDSLLRQTYESVEIILVDNGSTDGSLELIQERYDASLKIIVNPTNVGFAEGCNVGIRASRGELIALVNSDATLEGSWIEEMVKGMHDPSVGMCASKIYYYGKPGLIENTGQTITRDGLGRTRGRLERDEGQYDSNAEVFCPSGCAGLYRKEMLEKIGLFDGLFFAYADDIDVGLRGRLLGYRCQYMPGAIAFHKLSASFGLLSSFKAYLVERNRLWVLIKCFPLGHLLRAPGYTLTRYFYHFYGIFRRQGPAAQFLKKASFFSLVWVAVKVYLSTLWHLPYLLKERGRIRRLRQVPSREFEQWLTRFGMTSKEAALKELSF